MQNKPRLIIAGGSGFIGQALSQFLVRRNFEIVVLTRGKNESRNDIRNVTWNGKTLEAWTSEIDGAAAVINLAGRSINCRFSEKIAGKFWTRASIPHAF